MTYLKTAARALAVSLLCMAPLTFSATAQTADATELAFWKSVGTSGNAKLLQAYLDAYPEGSFAALAQIMITDLGGDTTPPPAEKTAVVPTTETPSQSPSADLLAMGDRCEELAAHPEDTTSSFPGVASSAIASHLNAAIDACLQATELGDAKYDFALGRAYYVASDPANNEKYFRIAADKGHVLATYWLAIGYIYGDFDTPQDWDKAGALLARPTQKDHGHSLLFLGQYYAFHAKDPSLKSKAEPLLEKAGKLGRADAYAHLGYMYETGQGVRKDTMFAKFHYETSIELAGADARTAKFYLARMYFKDIEKNSSGLTYHYSDLFRTERLQMLDYLKDTAPVFKEAYDICVTETARFYYDVVKFSVDTFEVDPADIPGFKKMELENAINLRADLLHDLHNAMGERDAKHPLKHKKHTEQDIATGLQSLRTKTANIDQTLLNARRRLAPIQAYNDGVAAGKKCAKINDRFRNNYYGADVQNTCAIDLDFSLDFVVNIGSGKPKLEHKRFTVKAGKTYTTEVSIRSLGGTSTEMTGSICPVSDKNEMTADGGLRCVTSKPMVWVKAQLFFDLEEIHKVLLGFAIVSR